jgi:regulator of nonsense transcripts 2
MITSAFLMVNPPPQTNRQEKEVTPLESYLRYLLLTRLEPDSVSFVSKQIQRLPWSDPAINCGALVTKYMLKACRRGRYKATKAIALLASNLKRSKPEVPARLIDDLLEEIQWFISHPSFRDHQRTLVGARLFGELYCAAVIPSSILFDEVHHILDFCHDIPDALRHASENQVLFAPRGNVSQTILEDETLEDDEEAEQENEKDKHQQPLVVSVSPFSKHDPRVKSDIDPPMAVFRIKLVCTILETATAHIVTANNKAKLEFSLASLQRYLFTKTSLPTDGEYLLYPTRRLCSVSHRPLTMVSIHQTSTAKYYIVS